MNGTLEYPDTMIPPFRFQFCPMCKSQLTRKVLFDDGIPLVVCPSCDWIYTRTNLVGAASVVTCDTGIVVILPPGLPKDTPAALPAGLIEYGESPEHAAVRETLEETGLESEIDRSLGWVFVEKFDGWPGPFISFLFQAHVTGGTLRGSEEGGARIHPLEDFPQIVSSQRKGSWAAINRYLEALDQSETTSGRGDGR